MCTSEPNKDRRTSTTNKTTSPKGDTTQQVDSTIVKQSDNDNDNRGALDWGPIRLKLRPLPTPENVVIVICGKNKMTKEMTTIT